MTRKEILDAAEKCVCGDRDEQYGSPENSFNVIARLWSVYLDRDLDAKDVAALMSLFKVARIKTGANKADNWIDLAGYAACGGELDVPNVRDVEEKTFSEMNDETRNREILKRLFKADQTDKTVTLFEKAKELGLFRKVVSNLVECPGHFFENAPLASDCTESSCRSCWDAPWAARNKPKAQDNNHCVICGEIIPEGRHVCMACELNGEDRD